MNRLKKILFISIFWLIPFQIFAWPGMPTPTLHVEGRYLLDSCGNKVLLHGLAMTPNPWFNGCMNNGACRWNNYDINGCMNYFKATLNAVTDTNAGWYCNLLRLHIDPYWTNNGSAKNEADYSKFDYNKLVSAVDNVIIPIIDYAKSRGMYVILRPPGVCPDHLEINDTCYNVLMTVWKHLSKHPKIKNASNIMFELANEPINVFANGVWGGDDQAHYDKLKLIFQPMVDSIRANGANNVIWVPGLGWQSLYRGYATNRITGSNIGYAVHIYPGYWGQDNNNPTIFKANWDKHIKPVADIAPIAITEINWAPSKYGAWGVGTTGTVGQTGFGANFKALADASGNVSWNLLGPEDFIDKGDPKGAVAYNDDPQACANAIHKWFKEYSTSFKPLSSPTIEPWYQVNNKTITKGDSVLVSHGTTLLLSPRPIDGLGTWSWTGAGTSGTSREQTINTTVEGIYTAVSTNTNKCSVSSSLFYKIIICDTTVTEPWYQLDGGAWTKSALIKVHKGLTLVLGPHPTDGTGTWNWTGAGTSGISREQTINTSTAGSYNSLVTYTNGCGAQSRLPIKITVCDSTIESWYQIDGGSFVKSDSIRVKQYATLKLSPNPSNGGTWSWTGAGTSGPWREQIANTSSLGTYTAVAIYTSACGIPSHKNIKIIVYSTTGIDENKANGNSIEIYPNPSTNGTFTIRGIEKITQIEILNLVGEKITGYDNFQQSSMDIHVSSKSGIFVVKLSDGQQVIYKKVVFK